MRAQPEFAIHNPPAEAGPGGRAKQPGVTRRVSVGATDAATAAARRPQGARKAVASAAAVAVAGAVTRCSYYILEHGQSVRVHLLSRSIQERGNRGRPTSSFGHVSTKRAGDGAAGAAGAAMAATTMVAAASSAQQGTQSITFSHVMGTPCIGTRRVPERPFSIANYIIIWSCCLALCCALLWRACATIVFLVFF